MNVQDRGRQLDDPCPCCRGPMELLLSTTSAWEIDPPPVDAAEYRVWRCGFCVNGCRSCDGYVRAKPAGGATRDERYIRPMFSIV